jgi:hypothetical protein
VAFAWGCAVDGLGTDPARDHVDEARWIALLSVVDQHGAQIHRVKRFGVRRYEPKLLETQARIDPLDPELQQAKQVGNFSRGSRSPHADDLFGSIDPQAGEPQRPRAQPSRLQNTGKIRSRSPITCSIASAVPIGSSNRHSTPGTSASSRGVIGSATA